MKKLVIGVLAALGISAVALSSYCAECGPNGKQCPSGYKCVNYTCVKK